LPPAWATLQERGIGSTSSIKAFCRFSVSPDVLLHLKHERFGLLTPGNQSGIPSFNLPNPPVFLRLVTKINFSGFV
jgi:hypothetical protein